MKKFLIIMVAVLGLSFAAQQANAQAIGLRLGPGTFFGGEISYLTAVGENRWEIDLGFGGGNSYSHLSVTGAYHWNWNIVEDLNWYVGPAAQVGALFSSYYNDFGISLGGQVGLEYDFNNLGAPIQLSLDARPLWDIYFGGNNAGGFGWGTCLGVRYTF